MIEVKKTAEALGISYNAVSRAIVVLMGKGILEAGAGWQNTDLFLYEVL